MGAAKNKKRKNNKIPGRIVELEKVYVSDFSFASQVLEQFYSDSFLDHVPFANSILNYFSKLTPQERREKQMHLILGRPDVDASFETINSPNPDFESLDDAVKKYMFWLDKVPKLTMSKNLIKNNVTKETIDSFLEEKGARKTKELLYDKDLKNIENLGVITDYEGGFALSNMVGRLKNDYFIENKLATKTYLGAFTFFFKKLAKMNVFGARECFKDLKSLTQKSLTHSSKELKYMLFKSANYVDLTKDSLNIVESFRPDNYLKPLAVGYVTSVAKNLSPIHSRYLSNFITHEQLQFTDETKEHLSVEYLTKHIEALELFNFLKNKLKKGEFTNFLENADYIIGDEDLTDIGLKNKDIARDIVLYAEQIKEDERAQEIMLDKKAKSVFRSYLTSTGVRQDVYYNLGKLEVSQKELPSFRKKIDGLSDSGLEKLLDSSSIKQFRKNLNSLVSVNNGREIKNGYESDEYQELKEQGVFEAENYFLTKAMNEFEEDLPEETSEEKVNGSKEICVEFSDKIKRCARDNQKIDQKYPYSKAMDLAEQKIKGMNGKLMRDKNNMKDLLEKIRREHSLSSDTNLYYMRPTNKLRAIFRKEGNHVYVLEISPQGDYHRAIRKS